MLPNKTLQNVAHSSLCSFCFLLRYQRVAVRSRIVYALPGRGFLAEAFAGLSSLQDGRVHDSSDTLVLEQHFQIQRISTSDAQQYANVRSCYTGFAADKVPLLLEPELCGFKFKLAPFVIGTSNTQHTHASTPAALSSNEQVKHRRIP